MWVLFDPFEDPSRLYFGTDTRVAGLLVGATLAFLVDAYTEEYGGGGKRLNLEWFKGVDCSKIILAGGLTPENILEVRGYGFYGVDVSSGLESIKGKKDPKKVKQFLLNAKSL